MQYAMTEIARAFRNTMEIHISNVGRNVSLAPIVAKTKRVCEINVLIHVTVAYAHPMQYVM